MGLKLLGEVALDGSGFERGLQGMASSVKGFIAGAFGLYGVETMMRKTMDVADELVNKAKRLDVTVEQLQVLARAAKDGGTELAAVAKGLENIDVAREKALSGSKEGMKLLARFGQLGISQDDLQHKTAADLFTGPMRKSAEDNNAEDLGPILKDILGKAYRELIPVLKTDFDALRKKMEALGLIMSTDTAVHLKAFGDQLGLLSTLIVNALGPSIVKLVEWMLWAVSHKGFMRDVLEGADFKLREAAGIAALGEGARTRHTAGVRALNEIQGLDQRKTTPEEFRAQWKMMYSDADEYGNVKEPGMAAVFDEDKSKSWAEELRFINSLTQPVADVTNESSKGAGEDMDKLQKIVEGFAKQIDDEVKRLSQPKPPEFNPPQVDEKEPKEKKTKTYQERGDALIRVGNFLGSSKSVLEDIGQKQVDLLKQLVENTKTTQTMGYDFTPHDDNFPIV